MQVCQTHIRQLPAAASPFGPGCWDHPPCGRATPDCLRTITVVMRHGLYAVSHIVSIVFLLLVITFGWLSLNEWKSRRRIARTGEAAAPRTAPAFSGHWVSSAAWSLPHLSYSRRYLHSSLTDVGCNHGQLKICNHPRRASHGNNSRPREPAMRLKSLLNVMVLPRHPCLPLLLSCVSQSRARPCSGWR